MNDWEKDLGNWELPQNIEEAEKKINCEFKIGQRVWWYFKEDQEFCQEVEDDRDIRECAPYSGIVIAANDVELRSHDLEDWNEILIIQDTYPTEKCYPQSTFIALNRLLDNEDLVEIFQK